MRKDLLRKDHLMKLKKMSTNEYIEKSDRIHKRLLGTAEFKEAETLAITVARSTEVETRKIIEACWAAGKNVVVPKCNTKDKTMVFRKITSYEQLETVYLDLQEPDPLTTEPVWKKDIDLVIVPGVVFTMDGYRIGYGGGYYDRYLEDFSGTTLSLAFELQLADEVPIENHDLPVGKIITEEREYQCNNQD
ncbi:5-formyltetrahydrofolate cyclo-ligase [Sporosarcina gallistercoris]|uniref:5-formyltetrahydrofolate cyclo-ligase n=1 Tax=Sporosarcina gallistercoris TaxID=2762245 RepID=A0ABR8PF85_9BACL|nr:5-formyltetrahydrofolate cyclo-ligase [Sporosarcina gallistercoris]MBD7906822.1 5-formyltetrahydrofolate cyclo-ligase [Sporosarcina gallistercoris]